MLTVTQVIGAPDTPAEIAAGTGNDLVTSFEHNMFGDLVETTDADGTDLQANPGTTPERITTYGYNAVGQLIRVTEDSTPAVTTDDPQTETDYRFGLQGRMDRQTTETPSNGNSVTIDYTFGHDEIAPTTIEYDSVSGLRPPASFSATTATGASASSTT